MKSSVIRRNLFFVITVILAASQVMAQTPQDSPSPEYWPTRGWRMTTPEQQGVDSNKLADTLDYIRNHEVNIHSLLVVRNGYIVMDAYFYPYRRDDVHDVASVTKSITSVLVGIAVNQGKISSVQQPVLGLFPDRLVANRETRKERLTLERLLSMSSGLECQFQPDEPTLRQMRQSSDWVQFMLDRPMAAEPGKNFVYCSGGMHLLSGIISQATGMSAFEFARRTLFEPLGIHGAIWPSDGQGVTHGWGDLHLHPQDMAKIGYLWLNQGLWEGRQIVSADWVAASTRVQATTGTESDYGFGWWVKSRQNPFIYEAVGRGGQRISVVPSKNTIVVMTGGGYEPGDFAPLLLASLKSDYRLPENPAGAARLAAALKAANHPPAPKRMQPLPEMAKTVSGRTYLLETNILDLRTLSLDFLAKPDALVRLTFTDNHTEIHPIGLGGTKKVSPGGRFGLPVGVRGFWENSRVFVLDYDEIANINALLFRLSFNGGQVVIRLTEKSANSEWKFEGKLTRK